MDVIHHVVSGNNTAARHEEVKKNTVHSVATGKPEHGDDLYGIATHV